MKETKTYLQMSLLPDNYRKTMIEDLERDEISFPKGYLNKASQKWELYTYAERRKKIEKYVDRFFSPTPPKAAVNRRRKTMRS